MSEVSVVITFPPIAAGDRVADSYTLTRTGTVVETGTAHNGTCEVPTARVQWDGETPMRTPGYATDTLTVILRGSRNV